jgi:hypothetical protein
VGDVEVPPDLEAMQALEHQPERGEEEQRPPTEPEVSARQERWVSWSVNHGETFPLEGAVPPREATAEAPNMDLW